MTSNETRVWGPPGTGKTTTASRMIVDAVKQYGSDRVLVASFTKAAAVELAGRNLPLDVSQVGTLHAICYRAMGNPVIAETRMSEWNDIYPQLRMTASAGGNDDPSWDMAMRSDADKMMAAYQTGRSRMLAADKIEFEGVYGHPSFMSFVAKWEDWVRQSDYVDFTGMIEAGLRDFDAAPGDPYIMFFDEAQDASPLDFALVRKWGGQMDKLVTLGDDDQAIFSFRGAEPRELFSGAPREQFVLSQSYRVPRAVHAAATRLSATLSWRIEKEYAPRDADGFVENLWRADYGNPAPAVQRAKELVSEGKTVMFLASCSYMLRDTCEALKEAGVPYGNVFKPKRADWNPLAVGTAARRTALDRVIAYMAIRPDVRGSDAHVWDGEEFRLWASCIDAKPFFRRGAKTLFTNKDFKLPPGTSERISAIGDLLSDASTELPDADHFGNALQGDLDWLERHLRGDQGKRMRYPVKIARTMGPKTLLQKPLVTVGTIHSVKGGEADCVFLYPDVSFAGMEEWKSVGPRRDSVARLFYVALTRAREGVYLCGNASQNYVKLWSDE